MKYSLDTSAILKAWREHLPPDVFPTVWQRLHYLVLRGELIITVEAYNELATIDDDVHKWVKDQPQMVVPVDDKIQPVVSQILKTHRRLIDTRKNRSMADPFVIALAYVENGAVVSTELPSTSPSKKPHIPDVCADMGISHLTLVDVLRQQGWTF